MVRAVGAGHRTLSTGCPFTPVGEHRTSTHAVILINEVEWLPSCATHPKPVSVPVHDRWLPPVCPSQPLTAARRTTADAETHRRSSHRRARGSKCDQYCAPRPSSESCRARHPEACQATMTSFPRHASGNALTLHRHQRYKVHDLHSTPRPPPLLSSSYEPSLRTTRQFPPLFADVQTAGTR